MRSCACCLVVALLICVGAISGQDMAVEALKPYAAPPMPAASEWPRQRLLSFMRELADFVYDHHVVKGENYKTYGMTYEFYRDGKWYQVFGLDTMHDGSWLMSSMVTAHRADPQGGYLERAMKYQIPFYVNMIDNSDRLFPNKQMRQGQDDKPLEEPLKGWVPRGWDEGIGYDHNTGKRFEGESYGTPSNHLAQDLADALLNVWLATRDPAVAEAVMHVRDYRKEYYGPIPVVEFAAGVTNGVPELYERWTLPGFSPQITCPYPGMYEQRGNGLPTYDDPLAWHYREATAHRFLTGEFPRQFALYAAAKAYGYATAMEMFCDDRPYQQGMYFFDIQRPPAFVEGTGKLDQYVSSAKKVFGARGIQLSWVAAGILPAVAKNPELWEDFYRQNHGGEPLVRIVDAPPVTEGRKDEVYSRSQSIGTDEASVTLVSDPKNLHILVESGLPQVTVQIRHADAVVGKAGVGRVVISREGELSAVNDEGRELMHVYGFDPGDRWTAELRIPYTVVPGQVHWINGVENGRYTVTINDNPEQVVYMLSEPSRIVKRLEEMTLGTIETWHGVWKLLGVIPSGWRSPNMRVEHWEVSDVGNYAHLIKTIALWLIYQEGKSEWEIIKVQFPAEPKVHQPLPENVLKAQGRGL